MNCDTVTDALLELPADRFGELAEHLDACPDCAAFAQRIQAAEAGLAGELEAFAEGPAAEAAFDTAFAAAFDTALDALSEDAAPAPIPLAPRRWRRAALFGGALAAAAALLIGLLPGPAPEPALIGQPYTPSPRAEAPAELVGEPGRYVVLDTERDDLTIIWFY
jgi:anti-sigma factor RsiW